MGWDMACSHKAEHCALSVDQKIRVLPRLADQNQHQCFRRRKTHGQARMTLRGRGQKAPEGGGGGGGGARGTKRGEKR